MNDPIDFLLEFIEHLLESDPDEGLALWSETFDQMFADWEISSCRRLLRIIKQSRLDSNARNEVYVIAVSAQGMLEIKLGNSEEAVSCYKKALGNFQTTDNGKETQAWLWSNLGNIYYLSGNFNDAGVSYSHAVELYRQIGDEKGLASALSNLGNMYRDSGKLKEASENYQLALDWQQAHRDEENSAITLINLGTIFQLEGNWGEAETAYSRALELLKSLGDFHLQAQVLGNLGTLYLEMNQLEKAVDFFLRDLEINQKAEDLISQSQTLNNLAIAYRRQQNSQQALHCYEGSLEIKKEIGDQQGELSTLINYSYLLRDVGESKRLDDTLKYARVLALSLQDSNQLSRIEELERDLLSPQ